MKKEYYALFYCDEWKSKSSMQLQGVFTKQKLIKKIKFDANYTDEETYLIDNLAKATEIKEINNFRFIYIESIFINEEL